MIVITGALRLNKGTDVFYTSPTTDVLPLISANFNDMTVRFRLYLPAVDGDGNPVPGGAVQDVAHKDYYFTTDDLATEDPQIANTLEKLRDAVEKKIAKDLKSYNPGADIEVEK